VSAMWRRRHSGRVASRGSTVLVFWELPGTWYLVTR
jgi:hypothetical protein